VVEAVAGCAVKGTVHGTVEERLAARLRYPGGVRHSTERCSLRLRVNTVETNKVGRRLQRYAPELQQENQKVEVLYPWQLHGVFVCRSLTLLKSRRQLSYTKLVASQSSVASDAALLLGDHLSICSAVVSITDHVV